jgi:hypothetical protein
MSDYFAQSADEPYDNPHVPETFAPVPPRLGQTTAQATGQERLSMNSPAAGWMPFEQPAARPVELEPGTVLGFTKRYTEDGHGYSFAALSVARLGWYLTGPNYSGKPLTWDELLDFIGGPTEWSQVGIVVTWAPLTGPR